MSSTHNHPIRCCCPDLQRESYSHTCPACLLHGELTDHGRAQDTPDECPSCHQAAGRPPTDYCQDVAWHGANIPDHRTTLVARYEHTELWMTEQAGRAARGKDHTTGPWCAANNCTQHHRTTLADTGTMFATITTTPPSNTRTPPQGVPRGQWLTYIHDGTESIDHRDNQGAWHNTRNCLPDYCGATPEDATRDIPPLEHTPPLCLCDPGPEHQHRHWCPAYGHA